MPRIEFGVSCLMFKAEGKPTQWASSGRLMTAQYDNQGRIKALMVAPLEGSEGLPVWVCRSQDTGTLPVFSISYDL